MFSKQQLIRYREHIKRDFRGTDRERLMRKLDTTESYEKLLDSRNMTVPCGLVSGPVMDVREALAEADTVFRNIEEDMDTEKFTNLRFYIGTPYYDRTGQDPFPLFRLSDPRVLALQTLARQVMLGLGQAIDSSNESRVNIIVRRYRPWDVINFHSDRSEFGETIYGIVLDNSDPERGLILSDGKWSYVLPEESGYTWKLEGSARWDWKHGYCSGLKCRHGQSHIRTSMTMRIFQKESYIPKKDPT